MTRKPALRIRDISSMLVTAFIAAATMLALASQQVHASNGRWLHEDHEVVLGYGCTPFELEPFDSRFDCPTGWRVHEAIDFDTPQGTAVYAGLPGSILDVGGRESHDYGANYIRMRLPDGQDLILGHLGSTSVRPGESVAAGRLLGYTGILGVTNWPNLHFEVRPHDATTYQSINPAPYLTLAGVAPTASQADPAAVREEDQAAAAASGGANGALPAKPQSAPVATVSGTDPVEQLAGLAPWAPAGGAVVLLAISLRRLRHRRAQLAGSWSYR